MLEQGFWNSNDTTDTIRLDVKIYFEEALQIQWIRSLTYGQNREFELQPLNPACIPRIQKTNRFSLEDFCVVPTPQLTFEHRRFVRHHVFQTEVYHTDSNLPLPVFRFHFQLVHFDHATQIQMNVEMGVRQLEATDKDDENQERSFDALGNPKSAWLRLMGLPTASKPEIVDVWHHDGILPARIIAQTKFAGVYPQVHIQSRSEYRCELDDKGCKEDRILFTTMQESDSDNTDEEKDSLGANEEDGREVEELNLDTKNRSSTLRKQKRGTGNGTKSATNEIYHPTTPDIHVNSPSSNASLVVLSLVDDDEEPKQQPVPALDVNFFRKKRSASFQREPVRNTAHNGMTTDSGIHLASPIACQGAPYAISPEQEKCKALFSTSKKERDPLLTALAIRAQSELVPIPSRLCSNPEDRLKPRRYRDTEMDNILIHSKCLHLTHSSKISRAFLSYGPQPGIKRRYLEKEQKRIVQLSFERNTENMLRSMEEYKLTNWKATNEETARSWLLTLGLHFACTESLIGWDQSPNAINCWQTISASSLGSYGDTKSMRLTAMGSREKRIWSDRLSCYISEYQTSLASSCSDDEKEEGAATSTSWMSLPQYFTLSSKSSETTKNTIHDLAPPTFTFANATKTFELPVYAIADWNLRDLYPVSVPKHVKYAIVCPHSHSEWLATLTLSYIASLKQQYINAHLGTQKGIDMTTLHGDLTVSIDHGNSLLLVNSSPTTSDPFESFRVAATKLHKLLRPVEQQVSLKDTSMSNVIYIVAPFRRGDIKHKYWLLGSFGYGLWTGNSGLCYEQSPQQLVNSILWKESVTIELVYLEDLYETCIEANPFFTLPACFGLFDRISESVQLASMSDPTPTKCPTRFITERLYHLGRHSDDEIPVVVYGAYAYASTGALLCSCVDPLGSVCEVFAITTVSDQVESMKIARMRQAVEKWLHFFALFGKKGSLIITYFHEQYTSIEDTEEERQLWTELFGSGANLPPSLSLEFVLIDLIGISRSQIQLCDRFEKKTSCSELNQKDCSASFAWNVVMAEDSIRGYLVLSSTEPAHHHGSHSILARSAAAGDQGSTRFERMQDCLDYREDIILEMRVQMQFAADEIGSKGEKKEEKKALSKKMCCVVRDFASLSYMTMHPLTLVRQSPFPLHVAALDKLKREMITLERQINVV